MAERYVEDRTGSPNQMGGRHQPAGAGKAKTVSPVFQPPAGTGDTAAGNRWCAGAFGTERDFAERLNKIAGIEQQEAIIEEIDRASYYIERNAHGKMLFHALTIKLYHIIQDKIVFWWIEVGLRVWTEEWENEGSSNLMNSLFVSLTTSTYKIATQAFSCLLSSEQNITESATQLEAR